MTTATRRALAVQAVQCRKDNQPEVQSFLNGYHPLWNYSPNPNGGWQLLWSRRSSREDERMQVWVGSWLVDVPETSSFRNIAEAEFERLYRTRRRPVEEVQSQ